MQAQQELVDHQEEVETSMDQRQASASSETAWVSTHS